MRPRRVRLGCLGRWVRPWRTSASGFNEAELRTLEDTPVVHAGNAAWFVREHRFDDAPFAVAEFTAHDSILHFGSLNHAQDQEINGQTACPLLEGEPTYGRHREIDAIDAKRTGHESVSRMPLRDCPGS